MTTPFITTGIPTISGPNGAAPIRREIRELQQNDPIQWNLFLLGLQALQAVDENDQLSFYQISGIHGVPFKAWNGVSGIDGQQTGYCTHSSILFLPWHRPYLALFEQVLSQQMLAIATQFIPSLRDQYLEAARAFRLPYWDWGLLQTSGQNSFPSSVGGAAQIQVTGPDGKLETITNPLHHCNIQQAELDSDFPDAPYNTWTTTLRYPTNEDPNATSQDTLVNNAVNSQNRTIRSSLRYVMGSISEFGPFSNDKWIPAAPGAFASLEDIHDNIHVLVGGPGPSNRAAPQGHMSIVPYAAFDPVFWLHHCNVDRLFAIWQVLHPDSYVEPEPNQDGTFTKPPGSTEDENSDLTPFWLDSSNFHTPKTARNTVTLGYAYPETQLWNFASQDLYQQSVAVAVNKLYGTALSVPSTRSTVPVNFSAKDGVANSNGTANGMPVLTRDLSTEDSAKNSTAPAAHHHTTENDKHTGIMEKLISHLPGKGMYDHDRDNKLALTPAPAPEHHEQAPTIPDHGHLAPNGKYNEWITNIRVQKHCLAGTFQVHIFLGDVPTNVDDWLTNANNVGTFSVLGSNPRTTGCEKCKADADSGLIIAGVILLTEALLDTITLGHIPSLDRDDVVPYLTKMLHWRVTKADGTEVPCEEVDELQISVVSTEVTPSTRPDELPSYSGEWTLHSGCTEGRPAGYSDGDRY